MILDKTYFAGDLYLPLMETNSVGVGSMVQTTAELSLGWYIDKYEREFLSKLLGDSLYKNFVSNIENITPGDLWDKLKGAIYTQGSPFSYSPAANYVYFFITSRGQSQSSLTGEVRHTMDFAKNVHVYRHLETVWIDMLAQIDKVYDFLRDNWNVYSSHSGNRQYYSSKYFGVVNEFNL